MEASINFELAVYISWFAGIFFILAFIKIFPNFWPPFQNYSISQPQRELIWMFGVVALLIIISTLFSYINNPLKNFILNPDLRYFTKLLIVYSPIWIYLLITKQSLKTCFISFNKIVFKLLAGIIAAVIASYVFLLIRGKAEYFDEYLLSLFNYNWVDLLQTFLEGFVVGFVLYRFYAVVKPVLAAGIVAILFMLSHLPSYITGMGISMQDTSFLIIAHTGISFFIFLALTRIQDVISVFFIHWFINAATDFTSQIK